MRISVDKTYGTGDNMTNKKTAAKKKKESNSINDVDKGDLNEAADEKESPPPVEKDKQELSPDSSNESEVFPDLDLSLDDLPESNAEDSLEEIDASIEQIDLDIANIASGESEVFPDLDLSLDDLPEGDEENLAAVSDIEKDLAQMADWQKPENESTAPEITQNPPDEEPVPDAPTETVAFTEKLPMEMPKFQQMSKISKIAATLGLTGMLIAASAIWLNMGLSDQLSQLRTEQQQQKNNMASVEKLAQEVEKLKWLQNQQAEIYQSGNDAIQQQLNNLTKVVSRKVTRQWQASVTALPAAVGTGRPAVDNTVTAPAATTPEAQIATAAMTSDMQQPESTPEPQVATAAITSDVSLDQPLQQLVVTTPVGNIRSIASTKGEVLFQLKRGSIVGEISRTRGWIQLRLQNGKTGWGYHTLFESVSNTPADDKPETDGFAYELVTASAQTPAQVGKKDWAVNLVSVETETTANKQVAYYQSIGINAEYALIPIKGKVWYRILISGFATERDAIAYKNVLARKYSISAWYSKMPPVYNR